MADNFYLLPVMPGAAFTNRIFPLMANHLPTGLSHAIRAKLAVFFPACRAKDAQFLSKKTIISVRRLPCKKRRPISYHG